MGTRGAYGFVLNGETKATYNHSDSYPTGLGRDFLNALRGRKLEDIKRVAEAIELVDEDKEPTKGQIKRCMHLYDSGVSSGSTDEWYCLLRNAQGEMGMLLDGQVPFMIDSASFLSNSLFCEWAYLINFDTQEVEIYRGFCEDPRKPGRYHPEKPEGSYWGVTLFKEIPLNKVISMNADQVDELVAALEKQAYPEEG